MYTKQTPALQHDTIIKQVIPSEHLFYQIYNKMAEIYKDLITIADYFLNQEEKIASSSFFVVISNITEIVT